VKLFYFYKKDWYSLWVIINRTDPAIRHFAG